MASKMDEYERKVVRRLEGRVTVTPVAEELQFQAGGITMVPRKQTPGSTSSIREKSGNDGRFDTASPSPGPPASPSPGQQKRPQDASQESTPRSAQKRLKFDQDLCLLILLPNGIAFKSTIATSLNEKVDDLLARIKSESTDRKEDTENPPRDVEWHPKVWLTDHNGRKLDEALLMKAISSAKSSGTLRILVHDGHKDTCHRAEWDITPEPEILGKLPQGYTLETALADQVDNALQAVWHNPINHQPLVSVTLSEGKITIFDTGQGMDASEENSIQHWGTVGGSMHRAVHHEAVGCEPPFLKPYLGKYGAGGVAAALHLGRSVTVWSKTRASNMVVSLHIEPKVLVDKRGDDPRQRVWKTSGTFRPITEAEKEMSPHESFTRVEISKLKSQYCIAETDKGTHYWKVPQVQSLLKDIYFPYIQTDRVEGSSSTTVCPVQFLVNGKDLCDVTECETAISNMHTCHGVPFIFDIHMKKALDKWDSEEGRATKSEGLDKANARITCRYYPNQKGKEWLDTVVEGVNKCSQSSFTFETLHRVTVRWLGRLLPEAKWPILPFMEVSPKKEKNAVVRRPWLKRVRAFVDTDAGFHPNQSKTQLETDQPFAVALKNTGSENLSGTSAEGVSVSFKLCGSDSPLTLSQLTDAYKEWVKDMHSRFDEDYTFLDEAIYIFHHVNAQKELGVESKQVIIFHKHMRDAKAEFKVDPSNPLRIRLPKGTNGLKSELFATVEFFFHDGDEDEHGEVKFLCRPLEVDEADGCKIMRKGENRHFVLNKSLWFPASLLSTTAKCLEVAAWKKKIEELSNKSPSKVEILKADDIKKLEMGQVFPVDDSKCVAKFEAGYSLPTELLVVVRPKKGTGPSHKQGMIVTEPMNIVLTMRHCVCSSPCWNRRGPAYLGKGYSPPVKEDHGRVVSTLNAQSTVSKSGVKGLYVFNMSSAEMNRLTMQGIYTFDISVATDKYKDVGHSMSAIQIFPARITSKWTLCNHAEDCTISQHHKMQPPSIVIRLHERLQGDLFIQKYDRYDNRQMFDHPLDLEFMVLTPNGLSLDMRSKVQANFVRSSQGVRYKMQVKNLLFKSGLLEAVEPKYEGLLRACLPNGQHAEMSCNVLPGSVSSFQVKDSNPLIATGSFYFKEALQPGEIIKKLTLQGLDAFGNTIEKGQKVCVQLEGLDFQDQSANIREVDDCGCLRLGGLLKVTSSYNSKGSITIIAVNGTQLCRISLKTVTRQLIATQVPRKSYVGRQLERITIEIVDESGRVDTAVDGYMHSVTADWLKGVTCVFVKGECVLPDFKLPAKPGMWHGKVSFSADRNLSVTLSVQLELAAASSLGPARRKPENLTAQCGVPFVVPFSVYDDQHQPAVLSESMKEMISANAEAKDTGDEGHPIFRRHRSECKDVKMSRTGDIPGYEAHVVLSGCVGTYVITLMDSCFKLKGHVQTTINLVHGPVTRLLPGQADRAHGQSLSRPLSTLEAKRCSPMPKLIVTLLDSDDNVCSSCEGRLLRMSVSDCEQWNVKTAVVAQGMGHFESSSVVVPVGSYEASIELDSSPDDLYSIDEQIAPIKAQFVFRVSHGNYPSGLRLLIPRTVSVALTEETIQYLPPMAVLVESADGVRLQSRPTVGVRIHGDNSQEYFGRFVENSETQLVPLPLREDDLPAWEAGGCPVRYEFTEVCVPPLAGTYAMEFFVRGTNVPSQTQHLIVSHGPPTRLEIVHRERGQELDVLQVHLVDRHGNTCEGIYGVEVALDLAISKQSVAQFEQCSVHSKSTTVVKRGKGDFGVFELNMGMPGMYTLKVFGVECDSYMNCLTPAEAQIFVTRGNVAETLTAEFAERQCLAHVWQGCLKLIQGGTSHIKQLQAKIVSLEDNIRKNEEELRFQEARRDAIRKIQVATRDDEVLQVEFAQPLRTVENVEHEIRCWAQKGNSAALALWEAQSEGNFLSPKSLHPASKDVLGLVVILGRVESEALNRILSEFMGVNSLLVIVTRTQMGVSALEEYDEHGNIDETKGLFGFARHLGLRITGTYTVLTLMDIRPYYRNDRQAVVDMSHPQRLLNIDPPRLPNGQVVTGFLGYAVNLVHLRPEHIEVRVATRQRGEFGLRESLFFHLLGLLQVYDTRQHMIAAKGALGGFSSGAISLDGGIHHRNQRQQLGRRSDRVPICFSTVPLEERMTTSLLPPGRDAFQRKSEMSSISADLHSKGETLLTMKQMLIDEVQMLHGVQKVVATAETERVSITEKTEIIKNQIAGLVRVAETYRSGSCGTPGESCGSQDSGSERMRAFMM